MPTSAEGIPPFDGGVAAPALESGTHYGTRPSLRVGRRSERVGRQSERAVRRFPFAAMLSGDLGHPETDAGMRFESRAVSSLRRSHADLFVGMPCAIGAVRWKRTTDAPRRPSALPRAGRASVRVASATVRARTRASHVPRDASGLPQGVPPTPREAPPIPADAPRAPRDAARVRRASPPEASDAPLVLRASRRARGHPQGTRRGASRARSDSMRFR
jgi:hypothetical protein